MMTIKNSILKLINQWKAYHWKSILIYTTLASAIVQLLYIVGVFKHTDFKIFVNKISLSFFFIASFLLLVIVSYKRISRWLTVSVNPQLMVLTRKVYALLCLFSAVQHFSLIKHGLEPYNLLLLGWEVPSAEAYILSALYIGALLLLFVGYQIRLAWVLTFVLGGLIIPFSLEIFLKNIFNFYAIFISVDLWKGKKTNEGSWAIVLMCLSASVLMSAAGLHKLLGPVWREGLGFYYSLNIAFFPDRYLWHLLDYKGLMYFFNWSTIIIELVALPLFLFKRTWGLVIWCFLGLALFLSFAMSGIGIMGGPIVFCMILLFLSLTSIPVQVSRFFTKKNVTVAEEVKTNTKGSFLSSTTLCMVLFWYTVLSCCHHLYKDYQLNKLYYPAQFGNFKNTELPKNITQNALTYRLGYINKFFLIPIQPHKFWQFTWSISLFNYHHLFDRLYFKVIFTDENDKRIEIINYFDEDGALSDNHPLMANERFILSCFRMMDAVRSEPFLSSSTLSKPMEKELRGIIDYSRGKEDKNKFKSATIYIKPMHQPYEYKGNLKPWKNDPWLTFYHLDFKSDKGKIIGKPETYNYNQLEIEAFKNGIIVPNF